MNLRAVLLPQALDGELFKAGYELVRRKSFGLIGGKNISRENLAKTIKRGPTPELAQRA